MKMYSLLSITKNQRGATLVFVAIAIFMIIALAALAVDIGHLVVTKNELQNAADAGALAGARVLYNGAGTEVNTGANATAAAAATVNTSDNIAVEVGADDVLRGHWSFSLREFRANEAVTDPPELWDRSTAELDVDWNFINAIQVTAHRNTTPVQSWFARILGYTGFQQSATAVAYIGFAGSLMPLEADQPIAICREALLSADGNYTCTIGRMINSGQNVASSETGGWTSFNQGLDGSGNLIDDPCNGGTNSQEVRGLVNAGCDGGGANPNTLVLGRDMATNGGQIQSAFTDLRSCWTQQSGRIRHWDLTLPVVECPGNNISTCQRLVGAVTVRVVWVTGPGEDPGYNDAPMEMDDWPSSEQQSAIPDFATNGEARWSSFVDHFNLRNLDASGGTAPAPYDNKSIYFLPDCTAHEPVGLSGGENFGILAEVPVLVD